MNKLRPGEKSWTPRPGGVIEHGNGRKYVVEGKGTLLRKVGRAEDREERVREQLKRLASNFKRIEVVENFDAGEFEIRLGKATRFLKYPALMEVLRGLPSNCGKERVVREVNRKTR